MKSYTKIYLKHWGYDESDFIPCLGCGAKACDIHHLVPRSRAKDRLNDITNLVALCRPCHQLAESSQEFNMGLRVKNQLLFI